MEEIVSTEALEREILEDARKKGERLLKDADAELGRITAESATRTAKALALLAAEYQARAERYQGEHRARLPLEKTRMKVKYIDRLLSSGASQYLALLPPKRASLLVSSLLGRAAALVGEREISLGYKGMDEAEARSIVGGVLPMARIVGAAVDTGLAATGIAVATRDGKLSVLATLDLIGERLLDENRGELAQALCAEALVL